MLNEVLYMETRVFGEFCRRKNMSAKDANKLFKENNIWEYIESCYDILHLNGDESVLEDIDRILKRGRGKE